MSEAKALMEHYRAVRDRLRHPPNAVRDTGINLKGGKAVPPPKEILPATRSLLAVSDPPFVPFRRTDLTFSSILNFIAQEFGLSAKDIRYGGRFQKIILPRQIAIWISTRITSQTLVGMAYYLKKDHTTMIHSRNRINKLIKTDEELKKLILSLEAKILANHNKPAVSAVCESHLGGAEEHNRLKVGCTGQAPEADGEYNSRSIRWNAVALQP